jgi:RNA-directed DNA polymerase
VQLPRATRLVICCRGTADEAMRVMQSMMSKLRLTVNEAKTRLCRVPEESVNFLGYTIGLCHSPRTGRSYIGTKPSAKKFLKIFLARSRRQDKNQLPFVQ